MKKVILTVAFLGLIVSAGRSWAVGEACRDWAEDGWPLGPSETAYELNVVREWTEDTYRTVWHTEDDPAWSEQILFKEAHWTDGGDDGLALSRQKGACWLRFDLEYGRDYVIAITDTNACSISSIRTTSVPRESFMLHEVKWEGVVYRYISASDWKFGDPQTVTYLLNVGGFGKVGTTAELLFRDVPISQVLPNRPGTVAKPIELDVTDAGSQEILPSVEYGLGGSSQVLTTAYKVRLVSGQTYVFSGESPSLAMGVQLRPQNPRSIPDEPVYNGDHSEMTIVATADYEFILLAMPDDLHWTANVGGGTLSWRLGQPEPTGETAVFSGVLRDVDFDSHSASFTATAAFYDDGSATFVVTAQVNGVSYEFVDNGNGEVVGEIELGGKTYKSYFLTSVVEDADNGRRAALDGSLFIGQDGVGEYWFAGELVAGSVPQSDDFADYDPLRDTAADMGLTNGAFANLGLGETLTGLWTWGKANGIGISQANGIRFSSNGDPDGLLSEAYLLNCAGTQNAVDSAKAGFRIVAFLPEDEVAGVVLEGNLRDGDAFGNGTVEVRAASLLGDDFAKPLSAADRKGPFYRAYLVCRPDVGRSK